MNLKKEGNLKMNKKKIIIVTIVVILILGAITINKIIEHKKEKLNSALDVKTEEPKQKNKTSNKKQKKKREKD